MGSLCSSFLPEVLHALPCQIVEPNLTVKAHASLWPLFPGFCCLSLPVVYNKQCLAPRELYIANAQDILIVCNQLKMPACKGR
jgi:hypothetical protein